MTKIAEVDKNMAARRAADDGLRFFKPEDSPFVLSGLPFYLRDKVFRRLPANPVPAPPNEGVDYLSWHTAGAQLKFRTDSTRVTVKAASHYAVLMDHMPQTGICGCDLYCDGRFWGVTRYGVGEKSYNAELFKNADGPRRMREFILNFPLYDGVDSLEVGLDEDAAVESPAPWSRSGSIVWYGTSIQQGGCASRPGMGLTNILSRRLNMEIVNLAFSGSGRGESAMAELTLQVPNPAMFILDYEANVGTADNLIATLPRLIDILRAKCPVLPLVVISRIKASVESAPEYRGHGCRELRQLGIKIQRTEVAKRLVAGDAHIYFIDGSDLLGDDFWECTVDGLHPTDLGFYRMAENLESPLRTILGL
ncbi:MAG: SGNH/GDSL hydrolase family protein [Victivallaceae bacterium]|nr:SGNH/GDSL hydrolase family protein [Victivallaceae bacterium]